MTKPDTLLMDEVKYYIKKKMISEGVFHARAPLVVSTQNNFSELSPFYKYPSKLRERAMYELIQNNYIEKNIMVFYRNVLKNEPDDSIFEYLNSKIPFVFLNIDTIEHVVYEQRLILEFKSFSGKIDSFVISKEEYDDIVNCLKSLERYDILLKIGA